MNEYKVICIVKISGQTCKVELTGYGDNENEAFEWAKDWAIRVGKADECRPLQAIFVSRLDGK